MRENGGFVGLALLALLLGCERSQVPDRGGAPVTPGAASLPPVVVDLSSARPAPVESAWTAEHTRRVELVCGSCHELPPPSALPRDGWEESILSMTTMPRPEVIAPLTPDDLVLAIAFYTRRAPERLDRPEPTPRLSTKLRFRTEHFTPRGLEQERIPAVANVHFVNLSHPRLFDLISCEMRSSTLLIQSPWGPTSKRVPRPLAGRLNYPVHSQLVDLNGDARLDLLIASMGGMNPSNDERGSRPWAG